VSESKLKHLERRVAALERVLSDLLKENAHQFVGGESFALDSLLTLTKACAPLAETKT
jgi:hypothetical protein